MSIKILKKVIALIKDTDISEVEIEENGVRLKIGRTLSSHEEPHIQYEKLLTRHNEAPRTAPEPIQRVKANIITSPFVGIFYRSRSPDSAPFVEIGDAVKKGDTLCIVEAMKLMNEVESECEGTIISILVNNADPIEYGHALFEIKPVQ